MKLIFREADKRDLSALVKLLADDDLGQLREDTSSTLNQGYIEAFQRIEKDPNNELIVVEQNTELVGMLQLTFIAYLTHKGSRRCLLEGVRISRQYREQGIGTQMIEWAIDRARAQRCSIVQLTSDKQRANALSFYRKLGFQDTHEGFKLKL